MDLQKDNNLPIIIHGKAYKPDVDMTDGSYSLLIGSYLDEQEVVEYYYSDPLTEDHVANGTSGIILLAHNRQVTYGYTGDLPQQPMYFKPGTGSIIVDPWRRFSTDRDDIKVIHYGNTRKN
jgi:hypothetical protein